MAFAPVEAPGVELAAAQARLEARLGRAPSDQEIAGELELSVEELRKVYSLTAHTSVVSFETVLDALAAAKLERNFAEVSMVPEARVSLDPESTRKALRLIELLEEHEDVQSVSSNLDVPDDFEMPE